VVRETSRVHPDAFATAMTSSRDPAAPDTLRVIGEVDLATAPSLSAGIAAHLERARGLGHREVDLDLSGVTFFSAAGLRTLLQAARAAAEQGMTLRLRTSQAVELVLRTTKTWTSPERSCLTGLPADSQNRNQ
jgi:anti-anti-sigma factor